MRNVTVIDIEGRKTIYSIPDNAPDWHGSMGLLVGPPSLAPLLFPVELEVKINNQLYSRGLITENDVKRRPNEVMLAIQAALKIDAQHIMNLYSQ